MKRESFSKTLKFAVFNSARLAVAYAVMSILYVAVTQGELHLIDLHKISYQYTYVFISMIVVLFFGRLVYNEIKACKDFDTVREATTTEPLTTKHICQCNSGSSTSCCSSHEKSDELCGKASRVLSEESDFKIDPKAAAGALAAANLLQTLSEDADLKDCNTAMRDLAAAAEEKIPGILATNEVKVFHEETATTVAQAGKEEYSFKNDPSFTDDASVFVDN